ncbi:GNAT family N-acetyltransferase [Brevibacillus sp. TJ4]|uniref:GNAT family N-acetyltransferase n=1 Tax=Brevibacillus sp. TJ4 TaxID=3234853 RepID=UPI0037D1B1CA
MAQEHEVHIRNAHRDEWQAAIELTIKAYQQYAGSFGPLFWQQYVDNIRWQWEKQEQAERLVAFVAGELAAALLLYPPQKGLYEKLDTTIPYPEIRLLGVLPAMRGKGVATALIRESAERAARAGYPYVGLHTTELMPQAVRLYQRLGFERAPEFDFYGDNRIVVEAYRLPVSVPLSS